MKGNAMASVATTKLSSKGQVVIPEEVRNQLGLKTGDQFVVVGEGDAVVLLIHGFKEYLGCLADASRSMDMIRAGCAAMRVMIDFAPLALLPITITPLFQF
jgi:AbrB family looped-hinge helix DNA binding protein